MFCAGFFHTRKKFKNFSKEVIKSHLSFPIWCGKRDKHFSNHSGKGVRLMKPSDFQKTVQCRFESCLKKVVRHVVKDYQQGLKRRKDKEIPFCELPEIFVENFAVRDDYETDYIICFVVVPHSKIFNENFWKFTEWNFFIFSSFQSLLVVLYNMTDNFLQTTFKATLNCFLEVRRFHQSHPLSTMI